MDELDSRPTNTDATLILESIAKVYCPHQHTQAEDLNLIRALNKHQAQRGGDIGALHILLQQVQSLEVLLVLLREKLDEQELSSVHAASLELLRFIDQNERQLISSSDQRREQLNQAFQLLTEGLSFREQSLSLLLLWYISDTAQSPELARYAARELIGFRAQQDTARLMHLYALLKLQENELVRQQLRQALHQISDDHAAEILHFGHSSQGDIIQRLSGHKLESPNPVEQRTPTLSNPGKENEP